MRGQFLCADQSPAKRRTAPKATPGRRSQRRSPVTSRDQVHHAVLWPICALELIFGVILLIYEIQFWIYFGVLNFFFKNPQNFSAELS